MVIQVENLVKRYGDLVALDHFGLQIAEGEIFGLLGPNGSGKTTAINCILPLLTYDKGRHRNCSASPCRPTRYDLKRRHRRGHAERGGLRGADRAAKTSTTSAACTCRTNASAHRWSRRPSRSSAWRTTRNFRPTQALGRPAAPAEHRLRHRAQAPSSSSWTSPPWPWTRRAATPSLKASCGSTAQGATIVYTSHYMEEVEQICTRIMIMDEGRAIATGTNDELKAMIGTGEPITVEVDACDDEALAACGRCRACWGRPSTGRRWKPTAATARTTWPTCWACWRRAAWRRGASTPSLLR